MFRDKKVLIVTPERLGDTLLCTPAIHYLKANYPSVQIDVLAFSELSAQTLKNNPDIHQVFVHPQNTIENKYDFALNIHGENYLNAPLDAMKLKTYNLPEIDYSRPQAEFALEFVQSLTPEKFEITERHYRLFPDNQDREYIQKILRDNKVDFEKDILVGCQIGCHSIAQKKWAIFRKKLTHPKVWPFEYFLELAERLYKYNPHIRLVLTGSESEKVLGNRLIKKVPSTISFIDKTNILQLRALIDEMDLFISPDTGVMHVACSADIPMIALFGPTNLQRTGPYPTLKDLQVIQAKHMDDISVDSVFNAVIQKLSHHLQ
ncbi:MAG TPA: glycosyltransferase family 9 protein [Gammaproteobacteria bacterium]|nr:glycosyltransferase family 9 protein [Gammaproteobacteria bacterium]